MLDAHQGEFETDRILAKSLALKGLLKLLRSVATERD